MATNRSFHFLSKPTNIAPLVFFRIAFGLLMFISILRFMLKGWVYSMYVMPKFHFPYYGFEWVQALPESFMYAFFGAMLIACLGITFGFLYRVSAISFFILFTYVELIDKTNYLNHYYFVSLISFLLIFTPANKSFSLDNLLFKRNETTIIPQFYILLIKVQLFLVYLFAGIAKINTDWLFNAQPLKMWLPAFSYYPIIGSYMEHDWVAYLFSWVGCLYDILIGFFLFNKRTVHIAYVFVVIFHAATALFFNIGMFPYIMIVATVIYFKEDFHGKIVSLLKKIVHYSNNNLREGSINYSNGLVYFFVLYFSVQCLLPFRYTLYSGNLFWTEQGYRFSWRVMLMEKAGTAFFYVKDSKSQKESEVDNKQYLTYMQEKMMSTQPDMMVDYAKFLKKEYEQMGYTNVTVRAQVFVTLNGLGTREFIDSSVDLSRESNSVFKNKNWIKQYE
ncbi:MAG: HTTM domain-containing protein [Bacteroidetes bacterium]|nr:HTTM domain-containing protein [Bacteroidota bacterium]